MVVQGDRGDHGDQSTASATRGAAPSWRVAALKSGLKAAPAALAFVFALHASGAMAQVVDNTGVQSVSSTPQALPRLNSGMTRAGSGSSSATTLTAPAAPTAGTIPATAPTVNSSQVDSSGNGGNVAELQRRIASKDLAELRTVYNGSYGASLLMATNDPTYYVALFERKNFWRVIKTQNDVRAEAVFADFARQTVDLASSEIRAIKLEAQRSATEQLIGLNKDRAAQIQADLAVQQNQQQEVSSRQQQALAQAAALADENRKAQDQLADLHRQLEALQQQANEGLPPVSSTRTATGRRH